LTSSSKRLNPIKKKELRSSTRANKYFQKTTTKNGRTKSSTSPITSSAGSLASNGPFHHREELQDWQSFELDCSAARD